MYGGGGQVGRVRTQCGRSKHSCAYDGGGVKFLPFYCVLTNSIAPTKNKGGGDYLVLKSILNTDI